MLSVVATFGSVILIQGIQGVNNFNITLDYFGSSAQDSLQESLVIEHVRFDPTGTTVSMWIRNTGTSNFVVSQISMTKIDTQEQIIHDDTLSETIMIQDVKKIEPIVNTLPVELGQDQKWTSLHTDGLELKDSKYRIFVVTITGNSFETIAEPYNT